MVCIYCGGNLTVSNSRPQKKRNQTWRRRPCGACGAVFTSIEALDLPQAVVVTRTADKAPHGSKSKSRVVTSLEPLDRDRLFVSIYESLRHRQSATSDARGLCDTVVAHIITNTADGSIPAWSIRQTVLNTLQRFDAAAASHYDAFHRKTV